jgi:peptidoglycan-N-acetylglucosamine deacetylase
MASFQIPFFVPHLFPRILFKKPETQKILYLTFDDGPVPEITEWVLDLLNQYNAKATFFCVGDNISKNPDIFQKIIENGHSVGNHTHNHLNGWQSSRFKYIKNIQICQEILQKYNLQTALFRPPYGRITPKQLQTLQKKYQVVLWDVLSYDFDPTISVELSYQKTLQYTENGSVIVFHDSIKAKSKLYKLLPPLLQEWHSQGYEFEKL